MCFIISRLACSSFALASTFCVWLTLSSAAGVNPPGYPPFPKAEYKPAGLGPREPDISVDFPGAARAHGLAHGNAVVSVLINAEGKAADFLVIGCTDQVFGTALMEEAKTLKYQAAIFQGVPVSARYNLGYTFTPGSGDMPGSKNISVNAMEEMRIHTEKIDKPRLAYSAVAESTLDHPPEFTNAALPKMPEGYQAPSDKPVKVFVTFYIDEEGHVREPNVESAASPKLIPGAIDAVLQWSFKPPLLKGKPALVFAGRAVGFVPRTK
jgi:hypothetical protein